MTLPSGALLPESTLQSEPFAILAAFVAINTVVYVALAIAKMLPKVYVSDWIKNANRRAQTRSIHPDEPTSRPPSNDRAGKHAQRRALSFRGR